MLHWIGAGHRVGWAGLATLGLVLLCGGCSQQEGPQDRAAADTGAQSNPADPVSTAENVTAHSINAPAAIYVEATAAEIDAARQGIPEEDFAVIADDLMFYRSTAIERLDEWQIPFTRIAGRRPMQFTRNGIRDSLDVGGITLLDFIVVHRGDEQPRVFAPNEIDDVRTYWQSRDAAALDSAARRP